MSRELERILNQSHNTIVTDLKEIGRLTDYVLSRPVSDLEACRGFTLFAYDISEGFGLSDFEALSIRDLLALIGYEPGSEYFRMPVYDRRQYKYKDNSAGHSFLLALFLDQRKASDCRLNRFMHIRLSSFADYLKSMLNEQRGRPLPDTYEEYRKLEAAYEECRKCLRLTAINIADFMSDNDSCETDMAVLDNYTIGDFIQKVMTKGMCKWMPFVISFDDFAESVLDSYKILNQFFMECIRMVLVPTDRDAFKTLIQKGTKSKMLDTMQYCVCYENALTISY